jgi:Zn-dependent metalloprotease
MRHDDGSPMQLVMKTHYGSNYQNAYWNGEFMTFGDGGYKMYPLVCLDVTSHEIAHGITAKSSGLDYRGMCVRQLFSLCAHGI